MKKIYFGVLATSLLLFGCSKSQTTSEMLVGSWKVTAGTGCDDPDNCERKTNYTFFANGNYTEVNAETSCTAINISGTWTVSGTVLTIKSGTTTKTYELRKVTSSSFEREFGGCLLSANGKDYFVFTK
jgi:hypothetical protein